MCWKQSISRFVIVTLFLLTGLSTVASADVLFGKASRTWGKVVKVEKETVTILEGCDAKSERTILWSEIRLVKYNAQCSGPTSIGHGGLSTESCKDDPSQLTYVVKFTGGKRAYAAKVEAEESSLRITLIRDEGVLSGPLTDISSIEHLSICDRYLPNKLSWPDNFVRQ